MSQLSEQESDIRARVLRGMAAADQDRPEGTPDLPDETPLTISIRADDFDFLITLLQSAFATNSSIAGHGFAGD
jgi:hypothetical protein